ncbi:MAG: type II toxin-antitoxin system prevent-host-death family antitoxin [Candidatus Acidiferrum sp.]
MLLRARIHVKHSAKGKIQEAIDMAIWDSYPVAMKVSVADAKNKLPELIKAVENGEVVTICRRGEPVVDVVRTKQPAPGKRQFGTMKDKIIIHDPDWWKPMTDEEVEAFLEGRY